MAEPRNRIGEVLIREGAIDEQAVLKATDLQARHPDRKFGEILVQDLGVDHHAVFSRLAKVYAFKEFDFETESIDEAGVEFVKNTVESLPDEVRIKALEKRVLPLKLLDKRQEMLLVVTADPTDREVMGVAMSFGYRRPEICYGRLDVIEDLINQVSPPKNEFLEILKETTEPVDLDEEDADSLDEAALDAEINQSMLTNLVEGCLVEAVRQGASDIHIIPQEGNRTEFLFRVDGKLRPPGTPRRQRSPRR